MRVAAQQDGPALGTHGGVLLPGRGGVDPDHVLRTPGRPHHQRLLGVRDDHRPALAGLDEGIAPGAGELLDLVVAVELVAGEVQQHQDLRAAEPDQVGDDALVGLQDRDVGPGRPGEGRGDAVVEVGPVGVGDDPLGVPRAETGPDRRGEEVGGGGLAVGAGHRRDPPAAEQLGEGIRVDPGHHLAADRRAGAPPGQPGQHGRQLACAHRRRQS
ncbi:hypothetical protein SDC9_130946 [bioreactor metagenome]|uniref:Uncharacterized protein n=1 Tax=bioreactor metagenome TaxID=1076179 RepID=A0A645D3Y5_9ZZZZ